MTRSAPTLLVAALVTLAVGLLTADGWPGYVIGAALALALWLILFFGGYAVDQGSPAAVRPMVFAAAGAFAVVLGFALFVVADRNGVWWAPAFIMAGAVAPWAERARRDLDAR